ncbi:MAG: 5-formyltetrahydrofolate cyclo-ligase [Bacillota bacterium]
MNKKEIRKEILDLRKELTEDEVTRNSIIITKKLISLDIFARSSIVMAYMDFKNEVMTGFLIDHCFNVGKRVALPLVDTDSKIRKLIPMEVKDVRNDVKPGTYGILEPDREACRRIAPEEFDFVIVPGLVFDNHRNRIGYGAGYYDYFLKDLKPGCCKAGIAFDFQIYPHIPKEEHDIPLDIIITEKRTI